MRIALDCEVTGLDLRHGAKPFLVSFTDEEGMDTQFEWEVDPTTREPIVVRGDLVEIQEIIDSADELVLQNPKFDVTALQQVFHNKLRWDWSKVKDTLLAGHLLNSNQAHDLTTMVLVYLKQDISRYEDDLKAAVQEARKIAKADYPNWMIAAKGLPCMPSARDKTWGYDMWLPRAIAGERKYEIDHPWRTLCSSYSSVDSASTLALYIRQKEILEERGLWRIYLERLKVLPVVYAMEERGVTISKRRTEELQTEYQEESEKAGKTCTSIALSYGYNLELPKSGNNKSLLEFIFDKLKLPVVGKSEKTGKPSLDKGILEHYELTLPEGGKQLRFIKALRGKRKRDTALAYLDGYEKFWLSYSRKWYDGKQHIEPDWRVLYPSLNPTGTDTLRWSSSNPNEQNISKLEGFNLRYAFGPAPGREWWTLDYQNLELRIPAFESKEKDVVYVFEHPDEAPYFGSYHLLVADLLHPKLFKQWGKGFKKQFASTWYQWLKNGNFAIIYGAGEETANWTYHVPGAYKKIQHRFPRIAALSDKQIAIGKKRGYVETIPDKSVDPERGYPLQCSRNRWGSVSPTVPLNYHVQGTAMWLTTMAMIRCHGHLQTLPGYYMVMQVHDEIVFDFPSGKGPKMNLPKIRKIKRLMEQGGYDIGVPTPVAVEYHPETWSEGITV